jgi:hypothetical protein
MAAHEWLLLLWPPAVRRGLERLRASGLVASAPNLWQIELGVLRMWHRALFRPETIGTCADYPVRDTWRARLLEVRPLRFPFLLAERAVAPWDMSGLLSSPERVIRHLLGAHHDRTQFIYDLQMLSLYPGALEELRRRLARVLTVDDARSRWLKDLTVYEGYHQSLSEGLERYLAGEAELQPGDAEDPDISFLAYLRWCARQPPTPAATWAAWRSGRFDLERGLRALRQEIA